MGDQYKSFVINIRSRLSIAERWHCSLACCREHANNATENIYGRKIEMGGGGGGEDNGG